MTSLGALAGADWPSGRSGEVLGLAGSSSKKKCQIK